MYHPRFNAPILALKLFGCVENTIIFYQSCGGCQKKTNHRLLPYLVSMR